jgi:hypothetical protein
MEDKKQRIYRIVGILKDERTEAALKRICGEPYTLKEFVQLTA